jgi:hypothetical protein
MIAVLLTLTYFGSAENTRPSPESRRYTGTDLPEPALLVVV